MLIVLQYLTQAFACVFCGLFLYDYLKWRKRNAHSYDIDSLCDYLSQGDEDGKKE